MASINPETSELKTKVRVRVLQISPVDADISGDTDGNIGIGAEFKAGTDRGGISVEVGTIKATDNAAIRSLHEFKHKIDTKINSNTVSKF